MKAPGEAKGCGPVSHRLHHFAAPKVIGRAVRGTTSAPHWGFTGRQPCSLRASHSLRASLRRMWRRVFSSGGAPVSGRPLSTKHQGPDSGSLGPSGTAPCWRSWGPESRRASAPLRCGYICIGTDPGLGQVGCFCPASVQPEVFFNL